LTDWFIFDIKDIQEKEEPMLFVVAKMNFFDNELVQELFNFEGSLYEAYLRHCIWDFTIDPEDLAELNSIEDIKQFYFNGDMMINILEMPG